MTGKELKSSFVTLLSTWKHTMRIKLIVSLTGDNNKLSVPQGASTKSFSQCNAFFEKLTLVDVSYKLFFEKRQSGIQPSYFLYGNWLYQWEEGNKKSGHSNNKWHSFGINQYQKRMGFFNSKFSRKLFNLTIVNFSWNDRIFRVYNTHLGMLDL